MRKSRRELSSPFTKEPAPSCEHFYRITFPIFVRVWVSPSMPQKAHPGRLSAIRKRNSPNHSKRVSQPFIKSRKITTPALKSENESVRGGRPTDLLNFELNEKLKIEIRFKQIFLVENAYRYT